MKWPLNYLLLLLLTLVVATSVSADTLPEELAVTFQFFNATDGVALNGTHDTILQFYDSFTGGLSVFNESQSISYFNGVGHAILVNGSSNDDWSVRLFMTVTVGSGTESTPRLNVTPVPQALYAENSTFAVNASNATYAELAGGLTGLITESQISDLQAYTVNSSDANFEILNASNWDNVSISQSQLRDHTIIADVGAMNGTNFTADALSSLNISGDGTSVGTTIVGNILTVYNLVVNRIIHTFTSVMTFTNTTTFVDINATNVSVVNLSISNPPAECPAGTYMVQFNGSVSLCAAAMQTSGDNATGVYNFTGNFTFVLAAEDMVDIDASTTPSQATLGVFRIEHTAGVDDSDVMRIISDINGFQGGKIMELAYTLTNMIGEAVEVGIGIQIDRANAVNGTVHAIDVSAVGFGTSTTVEALHVGPTVAVLEQDAGVFEAAATAFKDETGFIVVTTNFSDITSENATIFVNDNDIVYIGHTEVFGEIEVLLQTPASGAGIRPDFAHSSASGFDNIEPVDGTDGFRQNGEIGLDLDAIETDWNITAINDVDRFWIRITRTQNGLGTVPVEGRIQISIPTSYGWDEDGNVSINNLEIQGGTKTAINISSGNISMTDAAGVHFSCGIDASGGFVCAPIAPV